jgi:hypothetical protein
MNGVSPGVSPTQARRLRELEAEEPKDTAPPREPRTFFFFRDPDETNADIRAQIDADKRSDRPA